MLCIHNKRKKQCFNFRSWYFFCCNLLGKKLNVHYIVFGSDLKHMVAVLGIINYTANTLSPTNKAYSKRVCPCGQ